MQCRMEVILMNIKGTTPRGKNGIGYRTTMFIIVNMLLWTTRALLLPAVGLAIVFQWFNRNYAYKEVL